MTKKIVEIKHHFDDYECMWNGIEDLYMNQTGEQLPPNLFFCLEGFGSFCYMKTDKDEFKRMVALGDGRTKKMYEFLAPIVGFDYRHYEHKSFEKALQRAKKEIDQGYPCILGALDMYYLPYLPKLYHGAHIPFHYIMMVGYDEEEQCIMLYDCGRQDMQKLSYEELRHAWDCSYPGLSKPNTVCVIRMHSEKNQYQIAKEAFAKTSNGFLHPPVGFVGYRGFEKFIMDLPNWKKDLSKEDYDRQLAHMVEFYGTVPTVPNALCGIQEPDALPFYGSFDKMECVLNMLGEEYGDQKMTEAAHIFGKGAACISEIKDIIVDYLTGVNDRTDEFPRLYTEIKNILTDGFSCLEYRKIEKQKNRKTDK